MRRTTKNLKKKGENIVEEFDCEYTQHYARVRRGDKTVTLKVHKPKEK